MLDAFRTDITQVYKFNSVDSIHDRPPPVVTPPTPVLNIPPPVPTQSVIPPKVIIQPDTLRLSFSSLA
jgi:hypothetical protein